jgi:hypothetical protein
VRADSGGEAFVDAATWDALQPKGRTQEEGRRAGGRKPNNPDRYPLSTRIIDLTDGCGSALHGRKSGERLIYGCGRYVNSGGAECHHNAVAADAMLKLVLDALVEYVTKAGGREAIPSLARLTRSVRSVTRRPVGAKSSPSTPPSSRWRSAPRRKSTRSCSRSMSWQPSPPTRRNSPAGAPARYLDRSRLRGLREGKAAIASPTPGRYRLRAGEPAGPRPRGPACRRRGDGARCPAAAPVGDPAGPPVGPHRRRARHGGPRRLRCVARHATRQSGRPGVLPGPVGRTRCRRRRWHR